MGVRFFEIVIPLCNHDVVAYEYRLPWLCQASVAVGRNWLCDWLCSTLATAGAHPTF